MRSFVLPTAVYPEALDDLPNGRVATPLVKAPEWVVDPVGVHREGESGGGAEGVVAAAAGPPGSCDVNVGHGLAPARCRPSCTRNRICCSGRGRWRCILRAGWRSRSRAFLADGRGKLPVEVVHDPGVPPGKCGICRRRRFSTSAAPKSRRW